MSAVVEGGARTSARDCITHPPAGACFPAGLPFQPGITEGTRALFPFPACSDYALEEGLPFAIVPCCVFPRLFPHRRLLLRGGGGDGGSGGEGVPVQSYPQLVEYLAAKGQAQQAVLGFEGANRVVFRGAPVAAAGCQQGCAAAAPGQAGPPAAQPEAAVAAAAAAAAARRECMKTASASRFQP